MESCFCGRLGDIADRAPVYLGEGEWGLSCPECGHVDRLNGWPEAARTWILDEAVRRRVATVRARIAPLAGLAA